MAQPRDFQILIIDVLCFVCTLLWIPSFHGLLEYPVDREGMDRAAEPIEQSLDGLHSARLSLAELALVGRHALDELIEDFYNPIRRHTSIGGVSPVEFEIN